MIYLVTRMLVQERSASLVLLCGMALGFVVYTLYPAFGITVLLIAVPAAYDALCPAGAAYLPWLPR